MLIKKLIEYILYPLKILDITWKTSYYVQPYYLTIMSCLISYLQSISTTKKHIIYISFQIIPRLILLLILSIDIFYFHKLFFVYKFIFISIFPLIYQYIKYSLNNYTNHLSFFAKKDYEAIYITNVIGLLFGQEYNVEAIYDGKKVTLEEYIEIISENKLNTEYDNIESNIRYVGGGIIKKEFAINYAKRFFNKNIIDYLSELNKIELAELEQEFNLHYSKIFILKDLIPLNDEVVDSKIYRNTRIIIFCIYFLLWSYLLIISYSNVNNFMLTKYLLEWLNLYIEKIEPFSQTYLTYHDNN